MIDHLFIKNFKAFKKENIPLDRNTLLIGTNASGKTTVLEALDLFFNNVFNLNHVRDKNEDVVIEIHINDERYRKVYTPPLYKINFQKCIGKMYEINHIKYLHIPTDICNSKFLNDILTVNLVTKPSIEELSRAVKVFDYIDGDSTVWEKKPLEKLAIENQLGAYKHSGFWQPLDTLRDKNNLEELWNSKKAPWNIWE